MKKLFTFILLLQHCFIAMATTVYLVKKGDSLSRIAQNHIDGNIYSKLGSLNQLLQLNPSITNPHQIDVGQKIYLPKSNTTNNKEIETFEQLSTPSVQSPKKREVKKETKEETKGEKQLYFTPVFNFQFLSLSSKVIANMAQVEALSSLSLYFGVNIYFDWGDTKTFVELGSSYSKFSVSRNYLLSEENYLSERFSFGIEKPLGTFIYKMLLQFENIYFIKSQKSNSLIVDNLLTSSLELQIKKNILQKKKLKIDIITKLGTLIPIEIQSLYMTKGFNWGLEIEQGYQSQKHSYGIVLFYDQNFVASDLIEQTERKLGITGKMRF